MNPSRLGLILCITLAAVVAWLAQSSRGTMTSLAQGQAEAWTEVVPGIWRTPGQPAGYALLDGDRALLIDAPSTLSGGREPPGLPAATKSVDQVLLTHYHRDICADVPQLLNKKIPVRALKDAAPWLTADGVKKYWQESLPLRNSRTAYLVAAQGFPGIDCSLVPGQKIQWGPWAIEVVALPGHARAQAGYLVQHAKSSQRLVFCGGAVAEPGKLFAPYTTDWDHWTDAGLKPAAESLKALANLNPDVLCPSYAPVIDKQVRQAMDATLKNVEEAGFLKSFERFTKQRLGKNPQYRFLAVEQKESNGSKPWSQISANLYVTGNTFVLTSKDGPCLLIDPWDQRSLDQFRKLQKDKSLGPMEVAWFSHAHYDHYDGIYFFEDRKNYQVWALDLVAAPLADPMRWRAPFLDVRPIRFDKTPKDGDTLTWREYRFKFHHFPGQTWFTMAVETAIDGKTCWFTADNFFHQDMFSGSGGWMGLNRSSPLMYAASAQKVLDARPDWVLAEHGGPFEFDAEDFRRRVQWGQTAAKALDQLCPTGSHRQDWDPHRVHLEPILVKAKAGAKVQLTLNAANHLDRPVEYYVRLDGQGIAAGENWSQRLKVAPGQTERKNVTIELTKNLPPGRHVLPLRVEANGKLDGVDAFVAVDVE